jgi:hypothetical protein
MALFDLKFRATEKVRKIAGLSSQIIDLDTFELDPAEKNRLSAAASDGIGKLFFAHQGRIIIKWIHYLDIYQHHFSAYRNTPVKFLEIGVFKGGSLELWRNYFGMNATIFGIDIEPACATYVTPPNQVRIGSQDDAHFCVLLWMKWKHQTSFWMTARMSRITSVPASRPFFPS